VTPGRPSDGDEPPAGEEYAAHVSPGRDRQGEASVPAVARLLGASARRAERVAHATGVDRAFDQAVEEAIVRALRSPAVRRALSRATENERFADDLDPQEVARLVRRVLQSEAAASVWTEVLASTQAQMLVERIAEAPEVRAAITSQGAGLVRDAGVRLAKITEGLDDAVERVLRRAAPESETDEAGLVTRLAAAAVDFGLLSALHALLAASLSTVIPFLFGSNRSLGGAITLGGLDAVGIALYLFGFWFLVGQTPGMAFLSIRVRQFGSPHITAGCALRRVLALLPSLLLFGLGLLAIARDPQRRGWHDRLAHTKVVYDRERQIAPYSRPPAGR
jgi:uncharacterized RDD family membrane protein YckC